MAPRTFAQNVKTWWNMAPEKEQREIQSTWPASEQNAAGKKFDELGPTQQGRICNHYSQKRNDD